MPNELGVSLILNSLNKDYDQFVQNYNMHSMGKTIAELHDMLKLHKKGIPKKAETPAVLATREGIFTIELYAFPDKTWIYDTGCGGRSFSKLYLLKMKSYLDTLECLGYAMPNELGVSLILNSLNKDYDQFVQNYNMHSIGKTIAELHAMLKLH
nr:zinc finger, CCHC-type [Tanacetum cinerariifolium]